MKITSTKSKTMLTALGIMILLLTSVITGQQTITKSEQYQQRMIGNLITGINSENDGLKRSCIYFAGKYKIEETVDALVDQLEKENSTENKYLISLSLYLIGNDKGIEAVKRVAAFDRDPRAKRLAAAVYFECLHNESDIVASAESGK
jgi:HEAT repeat protein